MDAIGGAYRLDDGPVDRTMLNRINNAAQLLVPCLRGSWIGGSIGLVGRWSSGVDGAPLTGSGPLHDDRGRRTVVFDGRLDNRRELIRELSRYGVCSANNDAELTLAAYAAWEDDCASKLIGDFGFGLWDSVRRRLLCARDALGVRPLYVHVQHDMVCFATQLRQLLAAVPQTPSFDLEFVADRLAHGVDRADAECTPYKGISRLKPGHQLIAENGGVRIERFWTWRTPEPASDRDHQYYIDRFRETFLEAVDSRMRGGGVVWSDLSGGLDSSSIVSVATRNRRSRLPAVSVVFEESTFSDERRWSAFVAKAHDVEQHYIDGDTHHAFSRLREAVEYWEEPHAAVAFFAVHRAYQRLMGTGGVPVLLTGIGAEAVVMSKSQVPVHLADLLRLGQLGTLWHELDRWQRALNIPLGNLALKYCLRPLLSRPLVSYGRSPRVHDWIARPFARRWDLRERAIEGRVPSGQRGVADKWHVEIIGRITGFLLRGYLEKACDIRYPFLHRPLVELALASPWSLKVTPGEPNSPW